MDQVVPYKLVDGEMVPAADGEYIKIADVMALKEVICATLTMQIHALQAYVDTIGPEFLS